MKKTKINAFLGIISFVFLVFSVPSTVSAPTQEEGSSTDPLLIGISTMAYGIDPQNALDSRSLDIICQVSEGLFAYDLGDEYQRIVPRLAADCGTWNRDKLEFTVTIRENITFHNGHEFNATTVKASFDRLIHLIEIGVLQTAEIYEPLNDELVINETVVIDKFTVKFVLNYKFAPFISLLCFTGSMIVDASVMPAENILLSNGTLVGTGPYKLMSMDAEKVEFEYYTDYYRGVPAVKNFAFIKYENSTEISTALLSGDIHMGDYWDRNFLDSFEASDIVTIEDAKIGNVIHYMNMNNEIINKTMRHAISYAINYEYILSKIFLNSKVRMTSVVPPGIVYHQPQDVATYNVSKARQILIDAGLSRDLDEDSEDSEWVALANSAQRIATFRYSYIYYGVDFFGKIGVAFQEDLKQIGIAFVSTGYTLMEAISFTVQYEIAQSPFCYTSWRVKYNDPSNYINPLLSINSKYNYANVNDSWLQEKMMEGLSEFDETARAHLYVDIQNYIAKDLMPWVFLGFSYEGEAVHSKKVTDLQRNAMGYFYVFPLTWYGDKAIWDDEIYCNEGSTPIDYHPSEKGKIPGYDILIMLGVAAAIIIRIVRKSEKT